LRFNGESLLERHLDTLAHFGLLDLTLVVGHQVSAIEDELGASGARERVRTCFNPDYRGSSLLSLWTLREVLTAGRPVLYMDADVLYDWRLLERLLRSPHANCILIDRAFEPDTDPVEVRIRDGRIVAFDKGVPAAPHDIRGEWIGFARFDADTAAALALAIEGYVRSDRTDVIYEKPIDGSGRHVRAYGPSPTSHASAPSSRAGLDPAGTAGAGWLLHLAGGLALFCALLAGFAMAQRRGLFLRLARIVERATRGRAWRSLVGSAAALDREIVACYADRPRLWRCACWRFLGWLCGSVEIWLAFWLLGHPIGLIEAVILESLGQALRSAGFALPGGLGAQEGGIVAGALALGIAPELALAVALLKRAREVAYGVPGLVAWALTGVAGRGARPAQAVGRRSTGWPRHS
jgi:choline kinase